MEEKTYSWIPFYREFAEKLLPYENDRETLVFKIKTVFNNIDMDLPKLEDGELFDIDPFTIFGLFNKQITADKRIKIIQGCKDEFLVESNVPDDFSGIPLVNNQNATFYYFGNRRGKHDIDNLWKVFISAYNYAYNNEEQSKDAFIKYYDICLNQKNIKWNITMGLFWIAPSTFLNLDARNRDFILDSNNMPHDYIEALHGLKHVLKGEEYLKLCHETIKVLKNSQYEYKTLPELSEYAWQIVKSSDSHNSNAAFLRWMKPLLIALRELGGSATPEEAKNQIIIDEKLSDEQINMTRGKNNVNKFGNEVDFARYYLVYGGYISNAKRGYWTLTQEGYEVDMTPELASKIFRTYQANKPGSKNNDNIDDDISTVHYWIYAPGENSCMWDEFYQKDIMAIGWGKLGDLRAYSSKNDMTKMMKEVYDPELSYKNSVHATWQFVHELKENDVIFVKKGTHQIIGRGIVTSGYSYDGHREDTYKNQRKVNWTHKGMWEYPGKQAPMKTLTDMTPYTDIVNQLKALFEEEIENKEEIDEAFPIYREEDFLAQVYIDQEKYHSLVHLLDMKKNIILQGPPGVGKTYAAKRLAYSMIGEKNPNRVMMIQFHQSYAYEDFIEGYRPTENGGFELRKGVFYKFCEDAQIDNENKYFFIIDEINRGNLSKIFGELFMLIENDKRGSKYQMRLLYSNDMFYVPENVYIIGMMNTADRSLAMMDYALRRRFAFFEMVPAFDNDAFNSYKEAKNNMKFNRLINTIKQLNNEIENDDSLGSGFRIGHSYFCTSEEVTDEWMQSVIDYEIIPLLQEYWFDEPTKVKTWSDMLRGSISD